MENKDLKNIGFKLKTYHATYIFVNENMRLTHRSIDNENNLSVVYAGNIDDKISLFVMTKEGYPLYIQQMDRQGKIILGTYPQLYDVIRNEAGSVSIGEGNKLLSAKKDGTFTWKINHNGTWEKFYLKTRYPSVLYLIDHPGVLFKVLLHKLYYHKNELAHFCVYPASYNHPAFIRLREKYMWQAGILTMKELSPKYAGRKGGEIENLIEVMKNEYSSEMERMDINLDEFQEIYLYEDMQLSFEVFCLLKNYKYSIFEATGNCLWQIRENIPSNDPSMRKLLNYLLKNKENPIKRIQSTSRKNGQHPYHDGWEFFDYKQAFEKMSEDEKELIFKIFGVDSIAQFTDPINLYCSDSSLRATNVYNVYYRDSYSMNEMLLDYFYSKNEIVVKPHPKSDQQFIRYEKKVGEIPYYIPVEILEFINGIKINDLIVGRSVAINDLKEISHRTLQYGEHYQVIYAEFHSIYFAILFLKENERALKDIIHYAGFSTEDIELISKMECVQEAKVKIQRWNKNEDCRIVFIGNRISKEEKEIILEESDYNTYVFFIKSIDYTALNRENKCVMLESNYAFNIIRKRAYRDNVNASLLSEPLFMYSKNKNRRERFLGFEASKKLPYSGIEISISSPHEFEESTVLCKLKCALYEKILLNNNNKGEGV